MQVVGGLGSFDDCGERQWVEKRAVGKSGHAYNQALWSEYGFSIIASAKVQGGGGPDREGEGLDE